MKFRPGYIGWPLAILMLLTLFGVSLFATLVATERGSHWLLHTAVALSKQPLVLEDLQGSLARELRVGRFRFHNEQLDVTGRNLLLDVNWWRSITRDQLLVRNLTLDALQIQVHPQPDSAAAPRMDRLQIQLPAAPVTLVIERLQLGNLDINQVPSAWLPAITTSLHYDRNALALTHLQLHADAYQISGQLSAQTGRDLPLSGRLDFSSLVVEELPTAVGTLDVAGDLSELSVTVQLAQPNRAELQAELDLLAPAPGFTLALQVEEFAWQNLQLRAVATQLQGSIEDYTGTLEAEIAVQPWLDSAEAEPLLGTLAMQLVGDSQGLQLTPLQLMSGHGQLALVGNLAWSPALALDMAVTGRSLDPALVGMRGVLDLDAHVHWQEQALEAAVARFAGRLDQTDFAASGALQFREGTWSSTGFHLRTGDNEIRGRGSWQQEQVQVQLQVQMPDLDTLAPALLPTLGGDLRGTLEIVGSRSALLLHADLYAQALQWQALMAENLSVQGQLQPTTSANGDDAVELGLLLQAQRLEMPALVLTDLELQVLGDDRQAAISFAAGLFDLAPSSLAAEIRRDQEDWQLQVEPGARLVTGYGDWALDQQLLLQMTPTQLRLSAHCWLRDGNQGQLCIEELSQQDGYWQSAGEVVGVPLALLQLFTQELPEFAGDLHGRWQLAGTLPDVQASLSFQTRDLRFLGFAVDDTEGAVVLPDLVGQIALRDQQFQMTLYADLAEQRIFDLQLQVADIFDVGELSGRVQLALPETAFIASLSEKLTSFDGALAGHLDLTGTRMAPEVRGELNFTDGRLVWMDPYLELEALTLQAAFSDAQRLELSGQARSGRGSLQIQGQVLEPLSPQRQLALALSGSDLRVRMPDAEITVAPELALRWQAHEASLQGEIRIPRARLRVAELPQGAVARSTDVVILGAETATEQRTRLAVNLQLSLLDDVRLEGFGLRTRMQGDLHLQRGRDGTTALHGRVETPEGAFSALGLSFNIESGNLTFAGPPDNPFVSARAVRRIERAEGDITVGIHISGELQNLQSTLFSEPPMSEANALSYLMFGRPLMEGTEAEGDQLLGAAVALGLRQAAPLIDEVRGAIGLDELSAVAGASDDLTLIAGKRVSERLYMRYSYQAFLGLSALMLRYQLTDRMSLEATASESPGVDLMYRVTEE